MLRAAVMTARRKQQGRARETGPSSALSGAWLQERRGATSSKEASRTRSVAVEQLETSWEARVETKKTRRQNSKTLGRQNRLEEDVDERSGHEESDDDGVGIRSLGTWRMNPEDDFSERENVFAFSLRDRV